MINSFSLVLIGISRKITTSLKKLSSCIAMIRCHKCKKKIKKNQRNKVFQVILGNMDNGDFYGSEILYYHVNELTIPNPTKPN